MNSLTGAVCVPLFDGLNQTEKEALFGVCEARSYLDGQVIITEGEEGDALFIVASGAVQVEKATLVRGQEALLWMKQGECFGELTLVDRRPRSATVRATGNTEVLVFQRERLDGEFARNPDLHRRVLENLVKIMASRLRRVDENLIQSIYDSVVVVDRNLSIVEWNRVSSRWGLVPEGIPSEHFIGRHLFELLPHLQERFRDRIEAVMRKGEIARFLVEFEDTARGRAYVDTVVAPDVRGDQVVGAIVANRDITAYKSLEHQLIQSEKLAMAGQMAADIGHELNNYLSIISGYAELLSENPDIRERPRISKNVETILEQVQKIERFTASLMDFTARNTKKQPADLNRLIVDLVTFIQPQHRFRNVSFELHLDDRLPRVEIDSGQVQQVLLNLFANAADAMDTGRVSITTAPAETERTVAITVADNGPGMPPDVVEKVFETGYTTKRTGHGFGLPICKRILESHGGDIRVETEVGSGSTFTLTLPQGISN